MAGEEKRKLENRMKWVLTGGEEHWQDSKAIGREAGVEKKIEEAQLREQGTTRIKKRKVKSSQFYKRPDMRFTEARRARSKTDTTKPTWKTSSLRPPTTLTERPGMWR